MTDSVLSAADRLRFELLLRERRADVLAQQRALGVSMVEVRAARSGGEADDEHDPEGPTMSSEWSRIVGLQDGVAVELTAIDAALIRVGDGRYGVCARCGRPIGSGRLEARPAAELCIDCARLAGK